MDQEAATQIDEYVAKIEDEILSLRSSFHLIISDPSGNSFIENLQAPKPDPSIEVQQYAQEALVMKLEVQ